MQTFAQAPPASSFPFPRHHSFPPFFTRQPTSQTHHAQLQKWSSLILAYCRHYRLWKLSLIDAIDSELFWNRAIERRLALADAREVVDSMRKEGRAEWVLNGSAAKGAEEKNVAWVWWRNPEEWAGVIADWVSGCLGGEDRVAFGKVLTECRLMRRGRKTQC